ncbi:hypothetical protein WH50_14485 [Pokkaliibacter plantistimulans]|uniref:Glycosyltransferase RgtA/B/C/D-like domain-containing protein n=1 Tax=Pokkaliibacter plantistimulans TaxID=1635171 RepID=A0ABX5M104_9GAMM|nr:hypothetical protein WH50_14485 [Pokkaliibacter plantistimulans]
MASEQWQLACVVLILVLYRLLVITAQVPLFFDEAYYYFWSLSPDWGYYSKPPMVAWLIHLSTLLIPVSDLSVKFLSPVLYGLTTLIVARIANQLFDRSTVFWAGILFLTMPLISFNSLFITTDAPLMFCWALTVYLLVLALTHNRWREWLASGVVCGLGLMSKYTMVLLPLSLLLYLSMSPERRRHLRNLKLWAAASIAALVYLPNLLWNAAHHFISFRHTEEISQLDKSWFHFDRLLEFAGGQCVAFGMVAMVVLVVLMVRKDSYRDSRYRLLLSLALPYLLLMCLQAFLARANLNWAAPVYITATVAVAGWLVQTRKQRWLGCAIVLNLAFMFGLYHYHFWQHQLGIQPSPKNDPYHRILGWAAVGQQLSHWRQRYPDAYLLSESRELLAYLGFYTEPRFEQQIAVWNPQHLVRNHYDLIPPLTAGTDTSYLFVSNKPLPSLIQDAFAQVDDLGEITTPVYPNVQRTIHLYYLKGFYGYGHQSQ